MITSPGKLGFLILVCGAARLVAGPYSQALNDPTNAIDAPVPGFLGPEGIGKARYSIGLDQENQEVFINPKNYLNPLFFGWGQQVIDYTASEAVAYYYNSQYLDFGDASYALGPVTGDNWDVVSLGDMSAEQIQASEAPGTITIQLDKPVKNLTGADFVIFENGAASSQTSIFGELAYVEVSANGSDFFRFPSHSLSPSAVGPYGSIDPTNVHNLAGKHSNKDNSWGTPFDLSDLAMPGLGDVHYIRLIDIPGDGSFTDSPGNPIYDAYKTWGSGGFDLEAIGAIATIMTYQEWPQLAILHPEDRAPNADPDGDGMPNLLEYAFATLPWQSDLAPTSLTLSAGHAEITFIRDERLADLVYEVQASATLETNDWTTIATSTGGAAFQGSNGHSPVISEISSEDIQSIGVLRKSTVRDVSPTASGPRRFLRVRVTTISN